MAKEELSLPIIAVLAVAAAFLLSKFAGTTNAPFTGTSSQRGLAGLDQFGNPITPASGYQGQGIISS